MSVPFADPNPDPSEDPPQQIDPGRAWTSGDWLRRFGKAWSIQFCGGARHYGHAGDGKACGALDGLIAALPPDDILAAQERASAMFAEFFREQAPVVVDARYPFAFFVQRWGGLRVPAARSGPLATKASATTEQTHGALQRHLDRQKAKVSSAG